MKGIIKQGIRFIGLSGIGWLLDFLTYMCLGLISGNLGLNNTISSWVGVTFVFIFATRKVFKNKSKIALIWKYLIYILYQCILVFCISKALTTINAAIVAFISADLIVKFSAIIAKILVTPITMTLNFLTMKGIIEKL